MLSDAVYRFAVPGGLVVLWVAAWLVWHRPSLRRRSAALARQAAWGLGLVGLLIVSAAVSIFIVVVVLAVLYAIMNDPSQAKPGFHGPVPRAAPP
jgi:hypothetical protein